MEKNIGLEKHTAWRMINVEQISDYMVYLLKETGTSPKQSLCLKEKNWLSRVLNVSVPVRACTWSG